MLSQELRKMYNLYDRRRLLLDSSYFKNKLAAHYQEEYKNDCKILDIASGCGIGQVLIQYIDNGLHMDENGKIRTANELIRNSGLSYDLAFRAVSFFTFMVGWDDIPPHEIESIEKSKKATRESVNGFKKNKSSIKANLLSLKKYTIVHLVLSIVHILFLILLVATLNTNSSDPFSMISNAFAIYLGAQLIIMPLIFGSIGCIFSLLGLIIKKRWPYLVSGIVDSIGLITMINLILFAPATCVTAIAIVAMGFVTFAKWKSKGVNNLSQD